MLARIKQDVPLISGILRESLEIKLWLNIESMSDSRWISQKGRRNAWGLRGVSAWLGVSGGARGERRSGGGFELIESLRFLRTIQRIVKQTRRRRNPISFLSPLLFINRWLFLISSDEMHNRLPWDPPSYYPHTLCFFFIYTIGFLSKQTYEDIDFFTN